MPTQPVRVAFEIDVHPAAWPDGDLTEHVHAYLRQLLAASDALLDQRIVAVRAAPPPRISYPGAVECPPPH